MDEKKVRSIRLDDETNEKFKALCAELGGQGECMNSLINAFELNRSKSVLTDMSADINEFECLVNRLVASYTHALALKQDAETNAKETVERELKAKDDIINRLSDELKASEQALKDKSTECSEYIKEADNRLSDAVRSVSDANESITRLTNELNTSKTIISDKQAIIDGLTARIPETEQLQNQLKEKDAAIENAKTQYVAKEAELNNTISKLNTTITSLSNEIEKFKTSAEVTDQKHKVELSQTIAETKSKYLDIIENLRTDKDALKDEIYRLKINQGI